MMKKILLAFLILQSQAYAQQETRLQPKFDLQECKESLLLFDAFMNEVPVTEFASKHQLTNYKFSYRSPAMGLDNMWDLWIREDSTVFLVMRGTTGDPKSLLADFYCAMLPAQGEIRLNNQTTFSYKVAQHPEAAIHAGFLTSFAFIANDAQPKIDSLYNIGYSQYIVAGHSQGGAIAFLITSWLHYKIIDGIYPNMQLKMYATAPPKVGNSYYAYDFDATMKARWAYSVVNALDPIPEMPLTTQQLVPDMNNPNPLIEAKAGLKKEKLMTRIALKTAFNSMEKKAIKSAKGYQKYLGKYVGKFIGQHLPELKLPNPVNSTYFVRPGIPITMMPDDQYHHHFSERKSSMVHHLTEAYHLLLDRNFKQD